MEVVDEVCPRCRGFIWHRRTHCKCKVGLLPTVGDPAEFLAALGGRLRASREAMGLSLDNLAQRTGLSKAGIWEIEVGRNEPMARTLVALANALEVTTDYLLLRNNHATQS